MNKIKYINYSVFFKKLASPLRTKIISSLNESSKNVTQLCKDLNTEQSKISHALILLKKCSLVMSERKGKNIVYSLNKKTIIPILKLIDAHCKCCRCTK